MVTSVANRFPVCVGICCNISQCSTGESYAVKQTKKVEDNSQLKNDRKDPKLIANLVKDGNFGMPYLPEGLYADLRRLSMFRDQLNEDRIRHINRLHREMKIYFPEYKDAFGKVDGAFCMEVLKEAPFPDDIIRLGEEGLRDIWHTAKLRGRDYSRAKEIIACTYLGIGQTKARELLRNPANGFTVRIGNRMYAHKRKLEKWLINQLL